MPEEGRRGGCVGRGVTAQTLPRGWRGTMAGDRALHGQWDILRLSLCLFHLPAMLQGAGDQTSLLAAWTPGFVSSRLPGSFPCTHLSYVFLCACDCFEAHLHLVWQHPSPPVLSVAGSLWGFGIFITRLGFVSPSPCPPRAVVGWMGHSPALCRDAAAAMVAFAE